MGTRELVRRVTDLGENELMERIAEGDVAAFDALYDRTRRVVFAVVVRTLIDHSQSEEVTQEVVLEAWQHASRFDPQKGRAGTWLTTMAHRRAIDRVRSSQTSRTRDAQVGIADYAPPFDNTYEAAEITVENLRVSEALERISPLQRETVVMGYRDGRTVREIAEQLGVPIGTVKTRMRDGLARLRLELA